MYVQLLCDDSVKAELTDYFSFFAPNYQFNPLYKKRVWNGKIYLYNKKNSYLYGGLIRYLREFCKERDLSLQIDASVQAFNDITMDEINDYVKTLNLHSQNKAIEPRDY